MTHRGRKSISGSFVIPLSLAFAAVVSFGLIASVSSSPALAQPSGPASPEATFADPTTSSPIVLSNGNAFVWVVNPDDDSVSVIRTDTDALVTNIRVGDEPRSVAIDPDGEYVYIANAADNTVTVIRVTSTSPFGAVVEKTMVTGAEPWNIVVSPDGKRVFVANSVQDTITIIKADVNFPTLPTIIGNVSLSSGDCNPGGHHFQPRGLAVTIPDGSSNAKLYVTRFLSFVKSGGVQATDGGKDGLVCRLDVNTSAADIPGSVTDFTPITLAATDTGFKDPNGNATSAYPNQMQSIVIRGDRAYLPSVAASPSGPLRFNVDTHAFVNAIGGVTGTVQTDLGALNLHLGARIPEAGKKKLFFANPWAIAFTADHAYVASSASDLLVKLDVDGSGNLALTGGVSTTRYIDLNDPANAATSGANAGKNPLGIVIRDVGVPAQLKAYVMNYVSRNVSVVNLSTDSVASVIATTGLPPAGSQEEQLQVGAEVFFSSRGHFDRPAGTTVSTDDRLSSEGWQACSSCHFNGWTDGEVWSFAAGPRKSVPLNGSFNPHNPNDQRILNYSAIFDEIQDFELNIRNVSGPGPLSAGPPPVLDPNHGLLISDTGDINTAPAAIAPFVAKANAGRPQLSVKLPGSATAWPALDAMKEWVRFAIRTPNGALTASEMTSPRAGIDPNPDTSGSVSNADAAQGRRLFFQAGCGTCHAGPKWTASRKDFVSPPSLAAEIATESVPPPTFGNSISTTQYLTRFLSNIDSFNLNVAGQGNLIVGTPSIGAVEKNERNFDALGIDYNGDGKGVGFNIPSLLGIYHLPPYYHNGACETLACVLANAKHRTKGLKQGQSDPLTSVSNQSKVVEWLKTLDANTPFPINLSVNRHNIFVDPPTVFKGSSALIGANVQLFGQKSDLGDLITDLGIAGTLKGRITFVAGGSTQTQDFAISDANFNQNFGTATYSATFSVPSAGTIGTVLVQIDPDNVLPESAGDAAGDNAATRRIILRDAPPDTTPPKVNATFISDDNPFNDLDAIVTTTNVQVKIVAEDPVSPAPAPTSGLAQFCIVRYYWDTPLRQWVETACTFEPLPAPSSGTTTNGSFIVNATIPPLEGTAYAFVWVKDATGNISRTPGFDVVSFIPSGNININRNDVRLFRILLGPGQAVTFTTNIDFGDVDLSAFDGVAVGSTRVDVSANNGTAPEEVTVANTTGANRNFQIEMRAIVNSRITIQTAQGPALAAPSENSSTGILSDDSPLGPASPTKDDSPAMLIGGPPNLQTAIGEDAVLNFLPVVNR
jgi:YVTN family beta-propeller protein